MNLYRVIAYLGIVAAHLSAIAGQYDAATAAAVAALFWWTVADRKEWEDEQ